MQLHSFSRNLPPFIHLPFFLTLLSARDVEKDMSGLIERGADQTAEKMTLAHNFLTLHFMLEQMKPNSKKSSNGYQ